MFDLFVAILPADVIVKANVSAAIKRSLLARSAARSLPSRLTFLVQLENTLAANCPDGGGCEEHEQNVRSVLQRSSPDDRTEGITAAPTQSLQSRCKFDRVLHRYVGVNVS